jgi:hypothetical protein
MQYSGVVFFEVGTEFLNSVNVDEFRASEGMNSPWNWLGIRRVIFEPWFNFVGVYVVVLSGECCFYRDVEGARRGLFEGNSIPALVRWGWGSSRHPECSRCSNLLSPGCQAHLFQPPCKWESCCERGTNPVLCSKHFSYLRSCGLTEVGHVLLKKLCELIEQTLEWCYFRQLCCLSAKFVSFGTHRGHPLHVLAFLTDEVWRCS